MFSQKEQKSTFLRFCAKMYAFTIKRLEKRGSISLVNYHNLASIIIEPPSKRLAWFILSLKKDLWGERRAGGHLTVSRLLD
jgi:hypothetical protein